MDTSKSVFQLHGVDAAEQPVLRKKLRRRDVLAFFAKLEPTRIGMEACGGAHYWGRALRALGHEVVLLPPQYVKPYVQRNKNDAADADAICEAMSRPRMRFVLVKSAEQEAVQMLMGMRVRLVGCRTHKFGRDGVEFSLSPNGSGVVCRSEWTAYGGRYPAAQGVGVVVNRQAQGVRT